jgi:hypothetical protein
MISRVRADPRLLSKTAWGKPIRRAKSFAIRGSPNAEKSFDHAYAPGLSRKSEKRDSVVGNETNAGPHFFVKDFYFLAIGSFLDLLLEALQLRSQSRCKLFELLRARVRSMVETNSRKLHVLSVHDTFQFTPNPQG